MSSSYRDTMDRLRFTPEQKQAMIQHLTQAPVPHRRPVRLRRLAAVGIAAALALSLTAGATGALDSVRNTFAGLFGGDHTEILDQIGYPIGASDIQDGVTITADAIVGDTYNYAIVYSIRREDGEPLVSRQVLEAAETPDDALPLSFGRFDTRPCSPLALILGGGGSGLSYFYDADPSDSAIQYVEFRSSDTPIRPGRVTATFQDLWDTSGGYQNRVLLAEGSWTLEFHMAFEDSSLSLPAGQEILVGGMEATLDSVLLSPLSLTVGYTVEEEMPSLETMEAGKSDPYAAFRDLPVSVTYTDGTVLEEAGTSSSLSGGEGNTQCQISLCFDVLRPLEEVESLTIGGILFPVSGK